MFRVAASTLAKRALQRSANQKGALSAASLKTSFPQQQSSFHYSARREEEEKTSSEVAEKEGFMGTGLSHLYAIPAGIAFAVPAIEFEWYLVNEETLLASSFVAFCVVAYTQGGEMLHKSLQDESDAMLKIQNDAEDELINHLENNLEHLKSIENVVEDYQSVLDTTQESYEKLNAAGLIKPKHDLKQQMEKMLSMIAAEEQTIYDKAKQSMMQEATDAVTEKFSTTDKLKKAALDSAMAKLTGKTSGGADPVQAEYIAFFQAKGKGVKKADEEAEAAETRTAMLTKLNALADNDGMFFRFDTATGKPKLVV